MRRTPVLVTVLIALACSMTACSGSGGGSGAGLITPAATSTPSATAIASAPAHAIYEMIEGSLRAGTNDSLRMVRSADSVQLVGTQRMDGVTVAHYRFSPKVTSLPAGDPLRAALTSLGLTDVPVQLYVDADGHPLKVTEKVSSAGHQVSATCTATNINAEVDTPPMPPPSMVQN